VNIGNADLAEKRSVVR